MIANASISVNLFPDQQIPQQSHKLPFGYTERALQLTFQKKQSDQHPSSFELLLGLIPMVLMYSIFFSILYTYTFCYILPLMEHHKLMGSFLLDFSSPLSVKFNSQIWSMSLLSLIFLSSSYRTMFTKPGHIPVGLQLEILQSKNRNLTVRISDSLMEKIKELGSTEKKKSLFPRFCRYCLVVKPDRSHHCSVCGTCVLKMDHHCPYINNCVGYLNYKFFMNMLVSGTFASLQASFFMWEGLYFVWVDWTNPILYQVLFGITYFGNMLLSFVLASFLSFHVYLIMKNLTTIEQREKMQVKFTQSPYNKGVAENCVSVFGKNPVCWLFPICNFYLASAFEEVKHTFLAEDYMNKIYK